MGTSGGNDSDNGNMLHQVNIDDPDDEIEDMEYIEDIDGIMQFQHKILRKYAMLGMIKYTAVPYFHQLVTTRDYKMICIFEVFALNRSEDDFLENLGIYCNQRQNSGDIEDDQQQADQNYDNILMGDETPVEQKEEEPKDPNIELLL